MQGFTKTCKNSRQENAKDNMRKILWEKLKTRKFRDHNSTISNVSVFKEVKTYFFILADTVVIE